MATVSGSIITKTSVNTPIYVLRLWLKWLSMISIRMICSLTLRTPTYPVSLIITIQLMSHILEPPGCCGKTNRKWGTFSDK